MLLVLLSIFGKYVGDIKFCSNEDSYKVRSTRMRGDVIFMSISNCSDTVAAVLAALTLISVLTTASMVATAPADGVSAASKLLYSVV